VKSGTEFGVILSRGITGTYDSGTGILTLTGTASAADYQAVLRSVWVVLKDDDPPTTLKLEARVRDAAGVWSRPNRRTFPVTPVNDAPVLTVNEAGIPIYDADSRLAGATVRIRSGFTSGDTLSVTSQRGITGTYDSGTGVLTLTGNATTSDYQAALESVRLTKASGGTRTLEFQVTDAQGAASNAFLIIVEALP
jgi:hypothetical protein